ncbi:MAG: AraC family transcriptional regulator [Bacteroidales bacterium]|nr:AraC family transcriptional regulator [Bacteroidales bacterium]
MDFIERNLDSSLSLEKIANAANFSPYHFHRIFSLFTGESLNQFVNRKRVEKAASLLLSNPELQIGEVAVRCGFSSNSTFSRAFLSFYGFKASELRDYKLENNSKICKIESKNGEKKITVHEYIRVIEKLKNWRLFMETKIEVKEMPELNLVYVRHVGQFDRIGAAFERLMQWAGPRGLLQFPKTKTVTVYHDDPGVTEIDKVRQSACITVEGDVKVDGEIGKMVLAGNKCAVGRFEIGPEEFEEAWNSMCVWVAENGYQPEEGYPYEFYHNDPAEHPEGKFILDICVPVKPI